MVDKKVAPTHAVTGDIYLSDGVYMTEVLLTGSELKCKAYAAKMCGDWEYSDICVVNIEDLEEDEDDNDEEAA